MSKKAPGEGRTPQQKMVMQKFGSILKQARLDRGLSQSDVAREIWGSIADPRGYMVARNRDRISAYESGRDIPEPQNLQRLSDFLGIEVEKLAPDLYADAQQKKPAAISMVMVENEPDRVFLQVNVLTSLGVASQVIGLLSKDPLTKDVMERQ